MCTETLGLAQSSHVYRNPGFTTELSCVQKPWVYHRALMCTETLGLVQSSHVYRNPFSSELSCVQCSIIILCTLTFDGRSRACSRVIARRLDYVVL